MTPQLRRGTAVSVALHVAVLLALLVAIPKPKLPEVPPEASVSMQFVGPPRPTQKAEQPAQVPAPANTPEPSQAPPAPEPATTPAPNTQPNPVKTPADSKALLNTLEKLRALEQKQAPKSKVNPQRGGRPNGGGNPKGSDTDALTADQRAAIGAEVQRCWTYDPGAKGVDQMRVLLDVTTDANGVARQVTIDPADPGNMNDPVFRAFAERAVRAVLNPQCANLPLPSQMMGQVRTFKFRFSPL